MPAWPRGARHPLQATAPSEERLSTCSLPGVSSLEGEPQGGRDEVAVVHVVVAAGAAEARPGQVELVGGTQIRSSAECEPVPAFDEIPAGTRRRALHIVRPRE